MDMANNYGITCMPSPSLYATISIKPINKRKYRDIGYCGEWFDFCQRFLQTCQSGGVSLVLVVESCRLSYELARFRNDGVHGGSVHVQLLFVAYGGEPLES